MLFIPLLIATQFTLKKEERLKSHKLIEDLFSSGRSYSAFPLKALYQFSHLNTEQHLQAGFAVSKKNFKKAVHRNRIKRLLKEAYRLQKHELDQPLVAADKQLVLFLIFTGKELPEVSDLMEKVKTIIVHLVKVVKEGKT